MHAIRCWDIHRTDDTEHDDAQYGRARTFPTKHACMHAYARIVYTYSCIHTGLERRVIHFKASAFIHHCIVPLPIRLLIVQHKMSADRVGWGERREHPAEQERGKGREERARTCTCTSHHITSHHIIIFIISPLPSPPPPTHTHAHQPTGLLCVCDDVLAVNALDHWSNQRST
jgi:hypothetical protein